MAVVVVLVMVVVVVGGATAARSFRRSGRRAVDEAPVSSAERIEESAGRGLIPDVGPIATDDAEAVVVPAEPAGVDDVVRTVIERVQTSDDDVMAVVSAMVDEDLEPEQMEEVLHHLVARDRTPSVELTLTGPDVPARPGRLQGFADLSDEHKRRVIIRVLCLLVARTDDDDVVVVDDRPLHTVTLGERPADGGGNDAHLPARRRRGVVVRH